MTYTKLTFAEIVNKVAFIGIWFLVFSIPWASVVFFEGIGTIARLLGYVAFGIGVLVVSATGQVRPLRPVHLVMLAFMGWIVLSYFWSIDPEMSVQRIKTYLRLAAMVLLIWQFTWTTFQQKLLMQAYVLGGYVSIIGTIQNYLLGWEYVYLRYVAKGFDPNDLAIIMALGIPMSWYLSLVFKQPLIVWLNRFYLPLALVAILLTGSRAGFLAVMVGLTIILWTAVKLPLRHKLALAFIGLLTLWLLQGFVPLASWERIQTIPNEIVQGNLSLRVAIWIAGLQVFQEHPLLGVGAGAHMAAVEVLGKPRVAHNVFLSVLVENGLIGFTIGCLLGALALSLISKMPPLEQKLWIVLLGVWGMGAMSLSWEPVHPTWLLLALLVTQAFVKDIKKDAVEAVNPIKIRDGILSKC